MKQIYLFILLTSISITQTIASQDPHDFPYKNGMTSLHIVTLHNLTNSLETLLKDTHINNVNARDIWERTPLHYTLIKPFDSHALIQLIKANANLNAQDNFKETPLHDAVSQDNIDAVKILLRYGANCLLKNHRNQTALELAQICQKKDISQILRQVQSIEHRFMLQQPLLSILRRYNTEVIRIIIQRLLMHNKNTLAVKALEGYPEVRQSLLQEPYWKRKLNNISLKLKQIQQEKSFQIHKKQNTPFSDIDIIVNN